MRINIFLIAVIFSTFFANAQDVVISMDNWEEMRNEQGRKNDSIQVLMRELQELRRDTTNLRDSILSLQKDTAVYKHQLRLFGEQKDSLSAIIEVKDKLQGELLLAKSLSDKSIARLANGRLQRKYNKKQVEESLEDLNSITTPTIMENFKDVRSLLILFPKATESIKAILVAAQNDPRRESTVKMQQYIADYISQIKNTEYYRQYYIKRKQNGFWSTALSFKISCSIQKSPYFIGRPTSHFTET